MVSHALDPFPAWPLASGQRTDVIGSFPSYVIMDEFCFVFKNIFIRSVLTHVSDTNIHHTKL